MWFKQIGALNYFLCDQNKILETCLISLIWFSKVCNIYSSFTSIISHGQGYRKILYLTPSVTSSKPQDVNSQIYLKCFVKKLPYKNFL